jgi:PIN domain nuclease of toxin-antitoxin system
VRHILDASALLAFLHGEPGADVVRPLLDGAGVSAVNWAEILQKALHRNVDVEGMLADFADIGTTIQPFTVEHADVAARLSFNTRPHGLSLADRACLALANEVPVWTADRAWGLLSIGVDVRVIR